MTIELEHNYNDIAISPIILELDWITSNFTIDFIIDFTIDKELYIICRRDIHNCNDGCPFSERDGMSCRTNILKEYFIKNSYKFPWIFL